MTSSIDGQTSHPDDIAEWRERNVPMFNKNRFKLGVFGLNCSHGCTISHAETTFEPTFEHNVKIAQLADKIGFELLLPVGRWRHFGGTTQFNGTNLEVYTWAAAIACHTKDIMVFATSHVPTVHPILAAKQSATIDNISNGRFGINVVCGWFKPEMEMFGVKQLPHDERYVMANEWMSCVKRLWTEQDFDHDGQFYKIDQGFLSPKPVQQPHPVVINAGSSPAGIGFSARHADYNLLSITSVDKATDIIAQIKSQAAEHGRRCRAMSYALVCCRDTEAEAQALYQRIIDEGDWGAANMIIELMLGENYSYGSSKDEIRAMGERFIAGWGGLPLVGTPEQIVDKMINLADLGVEGLAISWLDYHEELKYFGERVLPLMREAGLRQ